MNQDHHNMNTGGGQPPGSSESQGQRVQAAQQQQQNNMPATTSATDLRVNSAAVNVALSSVAKYWVFTNLFPGPIPQVSVYGLPAGARIENGKPVQDLGQAHASILNGDPNIILGHHAGQSQVTVSAPGGQQIPVSQIIATQSGQTHALVAHSQQQAELAAAQNSANNGQVSVSAGQATHQQGHHSQQHIMQQQLMAQARPDHSNQQDNSDTSNNIFVSGDEAEINYNTENNNTANSPASESGPTTPISNQPTRPRSKRSKLSQMSERIKDMKNVSQIINMPSDEENDCDIYGKHVASQLKKLSEEQCIIAQEEIQKILSKCRRADIEKRRQVNLYPNTHISMRSTTCTQPQQNRYSPSPASTTNSGGSSPLGFYPPDVAQINASSNSSLGFYPTQSTKIAVPNRHCPAKPKHCNLQKPVLR